ncbi:hypothetical protein [Citrobacter werkmanii]|uniref:hypothetical protein n=1 Tax=Citrobacter werkmanii TaxID=67827 RepID=UPI00123A6CD1|nr:hypothetical protein [Citrobacter werkmanii]QET64843.1 hypothetical protein FOB24_04305 [Citrobacter werkmanii]
MVEIIFNSDCSNSSLKDLLTEQLDEFLKCVKSDDDLTRVLSGPWSVKISNSGSTSTVGTRVNINLKDISKGSIASDDNKKEFVESVIFELTNAKNSDKFAELESNLLNTGLSIKEYGEKKSFLESEASLNLVALIKLRTGYEPSSFGKAQLAQVGSHDKTAFMSFFSNGAHNSSGLGIERFPSKLMYAYKGACAIINDDNAFEKKFKNVKIKNKSFSFKELKSKMEKAIRGTPAYSFTKFEPIRCAKLYVVLTTYEGDNYSLNSSPVGEEHKFDTVMMDGWVDIDMMKQKLSYIIDASDASGIKIMFK